MIIGILDLFFFFGTLSVFYFTILDFFMNSQFGNAGRNFEFHGEAEFQVCIDLYQKLVEYLVCQGIELISSKVEIGDDCTISNVG